MRRCHATYRQTKNIALVLVLVLLTNTACSWFGSNTRPDLPMAERPKLAVLEFGMGIEISSLSSVKSIDEKFSSDQEALLIVEAVRKIRNEARRLLYERLATRGQFRLVPLNEVDAAFREVAVDPKKPLNSEQIESLRSKLEADIVVGGVVQDYGKGGGSG